MLHRYPLSQTIPFTSAPNIVPPACDSNIQFWIALKVRKTSIDMVVKKGKTEQMWMQENIKHAITSEQKNFDLFLSHLEKVKYWYRSLGTKGPERKINRAFFSPKLFDEVQIDCANWLTLKQQKDPWVQLKFKGSSNIVNALFDLSEGALKGHNLTIT